MAGIFVRRIGLLAFVFLFVLFLPIGKFGAALNLERVLEWLAEAGSFAPVLFIILMATSVLVSPIPSLPLDAVAGAFFGPFLGGVYAVVGALLGAVASFLIARFVGRSLLERFLKGHINLCGECSDKLLTRVVFVSRLLPFISFDVVSYGAGLTKMSIGKFTLATGVGMIPPTFLFTYSGSVLTQDPAVTVAAGAVLVLLFFLVPRWIEKNNFLKLGSHFQHGRGNTEVLRKTDPVAGQD